MTTKINRRSWLKSSLLAAGGIGLAPSLVAGTTRVSSHVAPMNPQSLLWEHDPMYKDNAPRLRARLLANENPYGPSKKVVSTISDAVSMGNRYAHSDAATLIEMIAEKEGVTKDHIMLGPGSTDLLEKTAIVRFLEGGNIVSADPSYMSLINTSRRIGATWKPIPLTSDFAHDLDGMAKAVDSDTKLVYICNPNNPTGSITEAGKLKSFCKTVSAKTPIFVDEAYLEFMDKPEDNTMVGLVAEGHDVIVARTFSKIHGMAGLRIGYIVAQPERIESITDMVRSTMGLSVTSLKGAIVSVQEDKFLSECKAMNKECRDYVFSELTAMGYDVIPSSTSFMIFPIQMEGDKFLKSMFAEGVGVRAYNFLDKPWCRVSMGTMAEMEIFLEAFKKVTA
ncbi:pyridoxal phosphate-dependent aminotransferase [Echinicola vietnamensis]|uniref:PLP-dependent enzyme, histidinol-phosphate/aromatic aminotransferase or cobyric acid decarboxylase n=1 Tax=Echinicola vietnamensis (strain DSM 17526 / LMG 23754 / KMM 6221) TaxID=926556 RepID=L0G299_ECHVK|nr:aminotransferase class I/II-fold pyridoxal phosphate-dependent enzyme [Echinicola vietnamensis]AGA79096.1 PLP-dependent enzyme, histidinol-phosphate/aromatic aminotransferase or cobyric acid decarboxylase [Echinicola vietnamensis DSM 17526]